MMSTTRRHAVFATGAALLVLLPALPSDAQSLRGSRASINRMYRQAHAEDLSFLETPAGVRKFVAAGRLVRLKPDSSFLVHQVSYPYVRPQVHTFVKRLGAQYLGACGEPLVVTSAVRPATRQPANSTERSVHPTGMAIDLRKPRKSSCLRWLRNTLLDLEKAGLIEATEERSPAHFHVAVFPAVYGRYAAARMKAEERDRVTTRVASVNTSASTYTVRVGDTLWRIAREYDTTVDAIASANALEGASIQPGQELVIPSGG